MENFNEFIGQLQETNATLAYFSDFEKARANTDKIKIKLNALNYLLGQEDLTTAIHALWEENKNVFSILSILLAVRSGNKQTFNRKGELVWLSDFFDSEENVIEFVEDSGLAQVFKNKDITNLVDYVFGVEVGMDTNARKNRTGDQMQNTVALFFENHSIDFRPEVYSTEFEELECLGVDLKRFDFVVKTKKKTYLIEVNYYNVGGSKLNEVARSYSDIAPKINGLEDYEFVWITDGKGWLSAKNKLQEAFDHIPKIYNLTTLSDFIDLLKEEL